MLSVRLRASTFVPVVMDDQLVMYCGGVLSVCFSV